MIRDMKEQMKMGSIMSIREVVTDMVMGKAEDITGTTVLKIHRTAITLLIFRKNRHQHVRHHSKRHKGTA